jgi:periplasmic protein TonB
MSAGNEFPSWEPRELGLPRAFLGAILLLGMITAVCVWISTSVAPKPPAPPAIQTMRVSLAQLPQPAPPARPVAKPVPPPPPVPPPQPAPLVIPKPPPVPSHIPVPTREVPPPPPPPPARHVTKPAPHPLTRRPRVTRPARRVPTPTPPAVQQAAPAAPHAAPAAPVVPTSGIPIYGERVYQIIQANQNVPEVLAEMGLSGTAEIEIDVAPNGKILSARVVKSSGVPIIDSTALEHARDAQLPPFNHDMPNRPHAFLVPIEIQPAAND